METEIEKKHDDIVEKVLRRIIENNLSIKLEKYMWKIREVRFLEVVIEPGGIKMENKKFRK